MTGTDPEDGGAARAFAAAAADFDRTRRQLIPCFDAFYGAAVEALGFPAAAPIRVLDLGAGTGLLSALVRAAYPEARLTVSDVAPEMLEEARTRFTGDPRVSFAVLDHGSDPLPAGLDAVVSALSIHHLDDEGKRVLFERIHAALVLGGVFVNADQVLGPTPEEEAGYEADWLARVRAAGVSEDDLAAARERMRHDRCAPLAPQLAWLREAGFAEVACRFQDRRFAVFGGRKRGAVV
jgi:tRNA (cmo5U34)-methyltransferase